MVSIVMPLYNAQNYLREAIDCVICQTYKDFELICIDDCSVDATAEIIDEYKRHDNRINYGSIIFSM